jgi:hypothetical protein
MAYRKSGKKTNINPNVFLNNIFILYFIFIIAVGNLFYLLLENNVMFITIFILIGLLTSFFNKNMIVILTTTVAFTNILKYGIGIRHTEGLENDKDDEKDEKFKEESNGKDGMVSKSDDLDNNKVDNNKVVIKNGGESKSKSDDSRKQNQIIMDLANLDDDKLDRLNTSLKKQQNILDNLNSMTPVIKSLDSFSTALGFMGSMDKQLD